MAAPVSLSRPNSYCFDLARELEGALVNSEGKDFQIDANFVRELIEALKASACTATPSDGSS